MTATPGDYSIQNRLLVGFSLLLSLFLGLTGVVLDRAFRDSVEAGALEQLRVQVYVLLAALDEQDGRFFLLEGLREPRFSQLNSGLYGFVSSPATGELWRSESALDLQLADVQVLQKPVTVGENRYGRVVTADGEPLFMVSYGVLWEDGVSEYTFSVLETSAPFFAEVSRFRTSLWSWLGGVAVLLLLLQVWFLRWGLSPLHRMARDLRQIETGDSEQLTGRYPRELKGVTDNLNRLIQTERKQQARYRTTLGDLAHSLKTPLAVISGTLADLRGTVGSRSESDRQSLLATVGEQLERMNQIVSYQLQRAVQSNGTTTLARQVPVAPAVTRILAALDKVYSVKAMRHDCTIQSDAVFPGDERDLLEILGNILDNAFKYGHSQVRITGSQIRTGERRQLSLVVEDDGPGIRPDQREFVLQRGARADTLARGQGIGLAVVTDIVGSYGGQIDVNDSDLGGARIQVVFEF